MTTSESKPLPANSGVPQRPPWPRGRRYTKILFIVFTLLLWFSFQLLARFVITCLPGGDACVLRSPAVQWLVKPDWKDAGSATFVRYLYDNPWLDALVSLTMLAAALWPLILIFFPRPGNLERTAEADRRQKNGSRADRRE